MLQPVFVIIFVQQELYHYLPNSLAILKTHFTEKKNNVIIFQKNPVFPFE